MRINNISNLGFQQQKVEYLLQRSWGLSNITHLLLNVTLTNTGNAATGLGRFPRHRRSLIRGRTISIFDWNEWINCMYIYIYIYIRFNWWFIHPRLTTAVWDHWRDIFFGYTITFPKLIWSRFLLVHANNQYCGWASEILHQKDSGMFTIYQLVDFAGPSTVWCHAMLRYRNTRPMWRVLPAFLHYACCGWILHSVFDGGIRRLFVRLADGGCFSVGFNSKAGQLMSIGVHKKYLHLSTCKWTSKILCFPNCLLASQVLRTSLLHWSNLGKPSIFNFLWPSPMDFWRILQRWDAAMPRCPCPSCCLSHLDHVLSRSADSQGPQNPGISSWLWSWLGGPLLWFPTTNPNDQESVCTNSRSSQPSHIFGIRMIASPTVFFSKRGFPSLRFPPSRPSAGYPCLWSLCGLIYLTSRTRTWNGEFFQGSLDCGENCQEKPTNLMVKSSSFL